MVVIFVISYILFKNGDFKPRALQQGKNMSKIRIVKHNRETLTIIVIILYDLKKKKKIITMQTKHKVILIQIKVII